MYRLAAVLATLNLVSVTGAAQSPLDTRNASGVSLRQSVYVDLSNLEQAERSFYSARGVFTTSIDLLRPFLAYEPRSFLPFYAYLAVCSGRSENGRVTLLQACPLLYEPNQQPPERLLSTDGSGALFKAQLLDERAQAVDVAIQILDLGFQCVARVESQGPSRSYKCVQLGPTGRPEEYWVDTPPHAVLVTPSELRSLLDAGRHRVVTIAEVFAYQERVR